MSEFNSFKIPAKPHTSSFAHREPVPSYEHACSPTPLSAMTEHVPPPNPRSFFSSLPPELRQEIWLRTFEPRTITLYIHLDMATQGGLNTALWPVEYDEACWACQHSAFVGQVPSNTSVTFSATFGVRPGAGFNRTFPRVPVALHVCRDSRAFALKHYEPCFSGTRFVYDFQSRRELGLRGFGEKKIWIAPKRDTIFLDQAAMDFRYSRSGNQEVHHFYGLDFLVNFAEQDAVKIRKLAVSATLVESARRLQPRSPRWPPALRVYRSTPEFCLATALHESLKGFPNLEQLLVYQFEKTLDTDEDHYYAWIDPEAAKEKIERICLEAKGKEGDLVSKKLPIITVQRTMPETWPRKKKVNCPHKR